jgi:hypothetical protein
MMFTSNRVGTVDGTGSVEHWTHPRVAQCGLTLRDLSPADGKQCRHLGIGERVFLTMRNFMMIKPFGGGWPRSR